MVYSGDQREYMRAWMKGLSVSALRQFIEEQGGKCAICGKEADPSKRHGGLVIDHDHRCCGERDKRGCGKCLRGILCVACNAGLGQFNDDPARLRKALEYLERPAWVPPATLPRINMNMRRATSDGRPSGNAKLLAYEVRDIRKKVLSGVSQVELAEHYGVTVQTIANVVHRRTYASIE